MNTLYDIAAITVMILAVVLPQFIGVYLSGPAPKDDEVTDLR